jgi:cell division septum initiation protein DivIVA
MWKLFKTDQRISVLEDAVINLDRKLKACALDGEELVERFRRLQQRVAGQTRQMNNQDAIHEPEGAESLPVDPASSGLWARMTARQRAIQMQVLNRRKQNGGA